MNEQIRELAENATLYTSDVCYPDDPDWHETRDQKFAELMVRECVSLFDGSREMKTVGLLSHTQVIERIEKHFGVKE
jgi:hypothetical protein